jgi:hypothetical protein
MCCKQFKTRILIRSNCYPIIIKGGTEMDTGIAYIVVGVMILVGAIYAGLEKIAKAIEKKK